MRIRGYYAIVDLAGIDLRNVETHAQRLLAARPACLQLRAKGVEAGALRDVAARLRDACRAAGVPFCVNDRLDVALAVDADVVHLGQEDLPLEDARRVRDLVGAAGLRIGFSTHNREQALAAARGGADYIALGPIFGTTSKANPDPTVGVAVLAEVCGAVAVPVVAIGGITLDNVAEVARAGAAGAAVIAAVDRAADPTAAGAVIGAAFQN